VDFKVSSDKAFTILDLLPSADSLSASEAALRELYGLAYYRPRWGASQSAPVGYTIVFTP